MPASVSNGQLGVLVLAIALFFVGGAISLARLWGDRRWMSGAARACLWIGTLIVFVVLVWHSQTRGSWVPLDDNFDAFAWLAVLLSLFVIYVQLRRPVGGIDWFVMPIVILLLIGAAVFGRATPHQYLRSTWDRVHLVGAYGGAVGFAVAAATGTMYLIANRRLRSKSALPDGGPRFGSLERLEHLTIVSVTLGFALLTLGAVTGFVKIVSEGRTAPVTKIVLTSAIWLVYALVLHSPINPRFRGRKTAMLSILGFVLMIAVLITVQLIPSGGAG